MVDGTRKPRRLHNINSLSEQAQIGLKLIVPDERQKIRERDSFRLELYFMGNLYS